MSESTGTKGQNRQNANSMDLRSLLAPTRAIARQFFSADEDDTALALPSDLLLSLLVQQLREMGLKVDIAREPDSDRVDEWKASAQLPVIYERWLNHTLRHISNASEPCAAGRARAGQDGESGDLWRDWDALKRSLRPAIRGRAQLVETALRALPDVLTGTRSAVSVFFPEGSFKLMEAVYAGNVVSDYFNELVAQSLIAYIRHRTEADPTVRLRILEIGAGTGATTTHVLGRLALYQDKIAEYCFTDLSTTFLMQARRRYASSAGKYMNYKIFNVERRPCEQELAAGTYDVVIAANVLHATENIRETVRNARDCLKQQGLLLLNELSTNDLFSHLAFALLEGWWRFKDESERMLGSPALAPKQWERVLCLEGFEDVHFPAAADHKLGQQIVAAVSHGAN